MGRGYSGNHPRFSRRGDERYDAREAYNKDLTASARLHYLENDRHDHESPAHSHSSPAKKLDSRMKYGHEDFNYDFASDAGVFDKELSADRKVRRAQKRYIRKTKSNDERSGKKRGYDERSGEIRNEMINEMIDERPDSPFNSGHIRTAGYFSDPNDKPSYRSEAARGIDSIKSNKLFFEKNRMLKKALDKGDDERSNKIKIDLQNFGNEDYSAFVNEEHQAELQAKQDEIDEKDRALIERYERANNSSSPMNACAKSEGGSGCVQERGGEWKVISNKTGKPWPANYGSKANAEAALRGYHAG